MPSIDDTIESRASEWVARRSAGCSPEDEAAFQAWHAADRRHQGAFLRAEAAWALLDRAQVLAHGQPPTDGIDSALLPLVSPLADRRAAPRQKRTRRAVIGGAMAASVGAAAIATAYALKNRLTLATGRGELRKVPLSDRSLATINTDSRIDVDISRTLRHVRLVKGEAWFEVAKDPDAPFVVSAGDVRVRAVGTAFAVRRRDSGADILVTEGTVETWNVRDRSRKLMLSAGGETFMSNTPAPASIAYQPQEINRKLAWREREIILRRDSLRDAVSEFNRYNARQIVVADPALDSAPLVGGFAVDQPEIFARAVHATLNVPVTIDDNQIIIGTSPG
jgi:transmembrane sensor